MILLNDDMFTAFDAVDDQSIDLLLTDFPYGTINRRNIWDNVIDLPRFWSVIDRICKPTCPVISTAANPFTSVLVTSNLRDFRYTLVWEKSKASGYLNSKRQPLRAHEDIVVFYRKQPTYNPQMTEGLPYDKGTAVRDTEVYGVQTKAVHVHNTSGQRYPRSVLYFKTAEREGRLHPTQKPLSLYEYLINTYSNPSDTVLDPCMGSGTTGHAALINQRQFIGFEQDPDFFSVAKNRLTSIAP